MRKAIWVLFGGLLAVLLMATAACGGDKNNDDASYEDGGSDSSSPDGAALVELLASDPMQALQLSSQAFADGVESMEGNFIFKMSGSGFDADVSGDFAYRAPDEVYMTMNMSASADQALAVLGDMKFETLILGDTLYMNTPFFGGWVVMSVDEIGADAAQYQKLVANHAPFDYSGLINGLSGVEVLGEEQIEGQPYLHLRLQTGFGELLSAISSSIETTGLDPSTLPLDALSGPLVFDLWVETDTGLPYRLQAVGSMDLPAGADDSGAPAGGAMEFEMRFDFEGFNGNVDIPDAPANAKSFVELFSNGDGTDEGD